MLAIADLAKTYGEVVALDGCSFTVSPGRMLGFLGLNGTGKTTAMRAIFGLVVPDRGTVTWQGHPISDDDRLVLDTCPSPAGSIYREGVLRSGARVRLRDAWGQADL